MPGLDPGIHAFAPQGAKVFAFVHRFTTEARRTWRCTEFVTGASRPFLFFSVLLCVLRASVVNLLERGLPPLLHKEGVDARTKSGHDGGGSVRADARDRNRPTGHQWTWSGY